MPWLCFKSKIGFSKHCSVYNCTSYVKSRAISEKNLSRGVLPENLRRGPYAVVDERAIHLELETQQSAHFLDLNIHIEIPNTTKCSFFGTYSGVSNKRVNTDHVHLQNPNSTRAYWIPTRSVSSEARSAEAANLFFKFKLLALRAFLSLHFNNGTSKSKLFTSMHEIMVNLLHLPSCFLYRKNGKPI